MNLGFSRRNVARHAPPERRRPLKRRRLLVDCFEERQLLTAGTLSTAPAQTFAVASYPPGDTPDRAYVAWTSNRAVSMGT